MAAAAEVWDCVVVGAGIEGSSTAWHVAKKGQKTLLVEQFNLPHTRGSSHGQSRIIRKSYPEDFYVKMMQDAYDQWGQIEKELGIKLYRKTGLLWFGEHPAKEVHSVEQNLKHLGFPHHAFTHAEFTKQYPMLKYPSNYKVLLDEDAGILMADKCLKSLQTMFERSGGVIYDGVQVKEIIPGEIISVKTNKGVYKTKNVVITAGPWSPKLLKPLGLHLPLQAQAMNVTYFKEVHPGWYNADSFHGFIHDSATKFRTQPIDIYGIPCSEYPNHMKVALHSGTKIDDPEQRDAVNTGWDIKLVSEYVKEHFPGLESTPSIVERCMYTVTPDEQYVLDTHPRWNNIVIGAGFSGHGFKLAPVVGKLLSELVTKRRTSYDLKPFKIARFNQSSRL